jgi:2-polyprenyl-3-methyl-5-hydroxy-6-metoxy-1,4-benzoquinol methylase
MLFWLARDPWKYSSSYQQWKYEQELQLLPPIPISQALELGCAEGIFTVQLAAHVEQLVAADISRIALMRAKQRCVLHQCENVQLLQVDLIQDELPSERFDLIVCSEVLYYVGNQTALREISEKLERALKLNGYLLTSNNYRIKTKSFNTTLLKQDEALRKSQIFGAEAIELALSETSLELVKVIQTPFHCTHLLRRPTSVSNVVPSPEIINLTELEVPCPQDTFFDWFSMAKIMQIWQR